MTEGADAETQPGSAIGGGPALPAPCAPTNLTARSRSRLLRAARQTPAAAILLFLAGCSGPSTAPNRASTDASAPQPAGSATHSLDTLLDGRDSPIGSPRDVIVTEEPWTYGGRSGRIVITPSFRLHTTVEHSLLLDRFPRFMEIALASYRSALGELPEPPRRLDTFVLRTRTEWESLTKSLVGGQAEIYLRIPRGGYAVGGRGVYYDIGPQDTLAIAAHEGWHQYTQATFRAPLPLWLEEGIGAYFEGFRWHPADRTLPIFLPWSNPERFDALRNTVTRDELIPLAELLVNRPQDLLRTSDTRTLSYYAQVWALTHFLHEGAGGKYREGFARLLREAADGSFATRLEARLGPRLARATLTRRIGDAAFRIYFNEDLDEAQAEYERFVRAAVLPGARQHMTQGQSPVGRN